MFKRLSTYLSFVRFSHSVFALPFALAGTLLAARHSPVTWATVGWILVAMVAARSAAMGFNRLVDARFDALNPRTANREIPARRHERARSRRVRRALVGRLRLRRLASQSLVLPAFARRARRWCSGIRWRSDTRPGRSCSSVWRWRLRRSADGWRWAAVADGSPGFSVLAIGAWVGGFDVLYACQDIDFDRANRLLDRPEPEPHLRRGRQLPGDAHGDRQHGPQRHRRRDRGDRQRGAHRRDQLAARGRLLRLRRRDPVRGHRHRQRGRHGVRRPRGVRADAGPVPARARRALAPDQATRPAAAARSRPAARTSHGDDANVFGLISATYTDGGGLPGAPALGGQDGLRIWPRLLQAEHFTEQRGVIVYPIAGAGGGEQVGSTEDDGTEGGVNYVAWEPVDLAGIASITVTAAAGGEGGPIEVRLDDPVSGPLLGTTRCPTRADGRPGRTSRSPSSRPRGSTSSCSRSRRAAWTSTRSASTRAREAAMTQGIDRRRFLGGAIGAGAAGVPRNRRGIQLYTMRRVMDNSQDEARRGLRRLGAMGYTEVEPYWRFEWTPQQFRRELEAAGLRVLASHDGLDIDPPARPGRTATARTWSTPPSSASGTRTGLVRAAVHRGALPPDRRAHERGGRAGRRVRPQVLLPQPRLRVPQPPRRRRAALRRVRRGDRAASW